MRKIVLFLALGATGFAVAAAAQVAPPSPGGTYQPTPMRADLNRPVTRADYIAQADARFEQMDTDHDGSVSTAEMQSYRQAMRDRRIARGGDVPPPPPMDGKHDGKAGGAPNGVPDFSRTITRQDFTDRAAKRFDRMDANHDGVLDEAERAAGRPMRGPRGGRDGGRMPPPADAPMPDAN